jgi:hypothetical protein
MLYHRLNNSKSSNSSSNNGALLLLLVQIPAAVAFLTPLHVARNNNVNVNVNAPFVSSSTSTSTSTSRIAALMDPTSLSDALQSTVSTMYTATLPPIDPDTTNAINTMKDYFIPTTSNDATIKALEGFVQSKQAAAAAGSSLPLPNSSDLIQFDQAMPGAKGLVNPSVTLMQQQQQYNYHEQIDKRELEWIAQQFDIYMRKIPFAVTLYALLDFFVLSPGSANTRDIMIDELEDDPNGVAMEWVSNAASKGAILASIVVAIIFIENLTYHPVV